MTAADKTNNIIITLMCNSVHPDENNPRAEPYKARIADTVMTILGH